MEDPEWACCHWPGRALRAEQELVALRAENERLRKALRELIEVIEDHTRDDYVPAAGLTRRYRDVLRNDKCSP